MKIPPRPPIEMASETLKETLDKLKDALGSPHGTVRDGDKSVTYTGASEIREHIKTAIQLDAGPAEPIVAKPRRPRR